MALTPDDVVTKQFQHVRFKEGFDPDEVDDFLDEIVVEWRKTIEENEQLKARVAELEAANTAEAEAEPVVVEAEQVEVEEPVVEAEPAAVESPNVAASAGILELAQRLHDEHVAEGSAKRDQLISDAQTKAAAILSEAEERGREEIGRLEAQKSVLEGEINDLQQFERDYRSQLRSYIEGQLRDLDSTGSNND